MNGNEYPRNQITNLSLLNCDILNHLYFATNGFLFRIIEFKEALIQLEIMFTD